MKQKQTTLDQAMDRVLPGSTVMIGGFMAVGTPEIFMDALVAKGVGDLTVIANDTGVPERGIIKLIEAGLVQKVIVSHIGRTPLTGQLMCSGEMAVELVPQGTLIERIRAGGAGLGGVLTQTGLGTDVAAGKEIVTVDGQDYLLEKPLRADLALLRGSVVDTAGNTFYQGTTRNFNPLMAMAADTVIMAAEEIVAEGDIVGENIVTPGIFVDLIVGGEKS